MLREQQSVLDPPVKRGKGGKGEVCDGDLLTEEGRMVRWQWL